MPLTQASAIRAAAEIGHAVIRDGLMSTVLPTGRPLELRLIVEERNPRHAAGKPLAVTKEMSWDYPTPALFEQAVRVEYAALKKRLRDEIVKQVRLRTITA